MSRKVIIGIVIAIPVIIGVIVGGAALSIYIRGGSGEASEEIAAPTLQPRESESEETGNAPSTEIQFEIIPEESEVRFILNEVLRGQPTTVIGRTSEVGGIIVIDPNTPANSIIGPIRINLRTLQTPEEMRNRTIRAEILETARDEYEFTEFIPKEIIGLPDSVEIGVPFSFTVVGDLPIRAITNEVSFDVTVNPISETRIEGSASTQVLRSDYDLNIPNVPSVANVTNEVQLEIDFVAEPVAEEAEADATPSDG
jgi:polyisoprenoid-binding protein YceI